MKKSNPSPDLRTLSLSTLQWSLATVRASLYECFLKRLHLTPFHLEEAINKSCPSNPPNQTRTCQRSQGILTGLSLRRPPPHSHRVKEMARSGGQRSHGRSRFIEPVDAKPPNLPLKNAVWQLTPKGMHVLTRFCQRNGINQRHVLLLISG